MSTATNSSGLTPARHESVIALLKANSGESNPKAIIRRLARDKVAYAKARGWKGPAFCPKKLASIFDIRCKMVDFDIPGDGRILPHPDGKLWIQYRSKRLPERQRFTIFHEFAHTLFPDFCKFVPHNHTPSKKLKDPEKEFENLCDIAASEMLLPLENVKDDLAKIQGICIEEMNRLSSRYEASIDATLHRFSELVDTVPCAVVFFTDQKGDHAGRGPLWAKYSCRNESFKGYIPIGTMPPASSVALTCYQNGKSHSAPIKETWWVYGKPRTWLAQAIKLPAVPETPEYSKVAVLLLPSSYASQ